VVYPPYYGVPRVYTVVYTSLLCLPGWV